MEAAQGSVLGSLSSRAGSAFPVFELNDKQRGAIIRAGEKVLAARNFGIKLKDSAITAFVLCEVFGWKLVGSMKLFVDCWGCSAWSFV